MARRIAAIAFATAGIFLLAGPGWALLCLGMLVEVGWPRRQQQAVPERVQRVARLLISRVRAIPQQLAAVGSAGAGVVLLPVGVGLYAGTWAALIVLGVLMLASGLLLDRAAG